MLTISALDLMELRSLWHWATCLACNVVRTCLNPQNTKIYIHVFLLLHVTLEFHSRKLICRNLYALFSRVKKAYTANQNTPQLFSQVDVQPISNSVKAFASQLKSCIVYIQIAFHIWRLFICASFKLFCEGGEKL